MAQRNVSNELIALAGTQLSGPTKDLLLEAAKRLKHLYARRNHWRALAKAGGVRGLTQDQRFALEASLDYVESVQDNLREVLGISDENTAS